MTTARPWSCTQALTISLALALVAVDEDHHRELGHVVVFLRRLAAVDLLLADARPDRHNHAVVDEHVADLHGDGQQGRPGWSAGRRPGPSARTILILDGLDARFSSRKLVLLNCVMRT